MFVSSIVIWAVLVVVFLVLEAGTVALVSIWFALGALAAVIVLALCCRARRMPAGAALLYAVLAMPLGVACSRVLFCLLDGRFRGIFSLRAMLCFWGGGHSMVGALLGALLGVLLASQLNNLMPIIGAFLDGAALPVAIEPLQVIIIALVAMVLALLSTLYPSWRAAATQPAEALRYE